MLAKAAAVQMDLLQDRPWAQSPAPMVCQQPGSDLRGISGSGIYLLTVL